MMKAALSALCLMAATLSGHAAVVTYQFSAELTYGVAHTANPPALGATGTGTFTWDTSTPAATSDPDYAYYAGALSITFAFGDMGFSATNFPVRVFWSADLGSLDVARIGGYLPDFGGSAASTGLTPGYALTNWGIELFGLDGLSGTGFPTDGELNSFLSSGADMHIATVGPSGAVYGDFLQFALTSIERADATPVPEPGTFALVGAGLLCMGAARRTRRNRRLSSM